MQEAITHER